MSQSVAEPVLYYTHNMNPRVAVAVARYLQAPVRLVRYSPKGDDRDLFLPLNANTLAPLLVENGTSIWETDAVALRLSQMTGGNFWPPEHAVEMMKWVSWSAHHFTKAGGALVWHNFIGMPFMGSPNPAVIADYGAEFHRYAAILDATLATRKWLVGSSPTYADFRLATALPFAEQASIPVERYGNIVSWHNRLNAIDAWREPFAGIE
jgi:glutathione S-transferase